MLGVDSSATDRLVGARFSLNYFLRGVVDNAFVQLTVQRRIVIVNGSNSELLFSLTPPGVSEDEITSSIVENQTEMMAAINSMVLTTPEPTEITVSEVRMTGSNMTIGFSSGEAIPPANFAIMQSDLEDGEFTQNVTSLANIVENSPGNYEAVIDTSALGTSAFFRIELP